MRSAFLEDADAGAVSHAVRRVLEARGVLVREHVSSRIRFQVRPSSWSWTRAGYVGIYQPYGERDVEVRLWLRARWPHRIFWSAAVTVLTAGLLTILVNPPGTTWFVVSFLGALALLVSTLLYMNTWRPVREEERALMEAFEAEFRVENVGAALEDEDARALAALEAELEGEVERRRVTREAKATRAASPRRLPSFKLRKP